MSEKGASQNARGELYLWLTTTIILSSLPLQITHGEDKIYPIFFYNLERNLDFCEALRQHEINLYGLQGFGQSTCNEFCKKLQQMYETFWLSFAIHSVPFEMWDLKAMILPAVSERTQTQQCTDIFSIERKGKTV